MDAQERREARLSRRREREWRNCALENAEEREAWLARRRVWDRALQAAQSPSEKKLHGQYGYSGHVINLPEDVQSFAAALPRLPSQLDIIVVRKDRANQSHHDFHVRRSVVSRALQWLITNNRYYRANQICINLDALSQLPEDSDVINDMSVVRDNQTQQASLGSIAQDSDVQDDHLPRSFVPSLSPSFTCRRRGCSTLSTAAPT